MAAFLIGANTNSVPDEIKAKRFVLVDDDGKEMVVLRSFKHGGIIDVIGKNGKRAATLAASSEGGTLGMIHEGTPVAELSSGKIGGVLSIYDFRRIDEDVFETVSINQGSISVSINFEDRIRISSNETGGTIQIFNKTDEDVVQLRVDEYGNGVVGAYNRKGQGRTLQPGP